MLPGRPGKPASEIDPRSLYDYYTTFTASIKPVIQSKVMQDITKINLDRLCQSRVYLNPAVDIVYHISTKKYSAALYDAVLLLNTSGPLFWSGQKGKIIWGVANRISFLQPTVTLLVADFAWQLVARSEIKPEISELWILYVISMFDPNKKTAL